jgi:2-polyprenyl-6-methoxyphenol hydroxylase-like FAD-dependent oxidoreductase
MSGVVDGQLPEQRPIVTLEVSDQYDVAILGGGMAGLTLALQLKKARPSTRILVVEKQKHPVPEAAHKVGESTVEIAAHYLRDVLGLGVHLRTQQLRKFGLRMFFSTEQNQDITRRVEFGQIAQAPLEAYQLDRGRLENALGCELRQQGITFLDSCAVRQITLQRDTHSLHLLHEERDITVQAHWVVDASGRRSLLKRQLGLAKPVAHTANAVWFRVGRTIDINDWSADPQWRDLLSPQRLGCLIDTKDRSADPQWQYRVFGGERSLSTNHLMGPGYWVWLIRLASDATSIGIVTDAVMHPFEQINRLERALAWLGSHEPQCAAVIEQHRDEILDFRVMKNYAYSSEQVYSGQRWCLTGEAAVSIDPLYSSGGDLIAIGNGLICDLINRELDGEDIQTRAVVHNQIFLVLVDVWLGLYHQQYRLMGNAQVMVAKLIWDTAVYWGGPGLLYFHDKFCRMMDSPGIALSFNRFTFLHSIVQAFFREWHEIDQPATADKFIEPYILLDFLVKLHVGMAAGLSDAELEAQFAANVRLFERLAGQMVGKVIERYAQSENEAVLNQLQRWRAAPSLMELVAIYQREEQAYPIDSSWINLAYQCGYGQEIAR